ncbi:hypothetical protein GW17_00060280 [Ensete ventricosum]|nr:hypothetical protein GW17_00060280 [Ensete ventricosum]
MQWELVGSLSKVSEAYREFAESSSKVIGSLPGRCREFTGRRPRDSIEDYRGLRKAYRDDSTTSDRWWYHLYPDFSNTFEFFGSNF